VQGRIQKFDERQRLDWQHVWGQNVNDDGGHRNIVIAAAYMAANQEAFRASGYALNGADAHAAVDIAGTWNTSGSPTGIKLNITNNASGGGSLLLDLQVNGASKFSVDTIGNVIASGTLSGGGLFPAGMLVAYGGITAPGGWLFCDGSAVSRTTFAALFAAIGGLYGVGDGATTFNVPDLRGRIPIGKTTPTGAATSGGAPGADVAGSFPVVEGASAHFAGSMLGFDLAAGPRLYAFDSSSGWTAYSPSQTGIGVTPVKTFGVDLPFETFNYIIKT
jgi:hypothetical protein